PIISCDIHPLTNLRELRHLVHELKLSEEQKNAWIRHWISEGLAGLEAHLARDTGCLFSIDSDAHAPGQLDFLSYGAERAEAAGIEPERIVNTWPIDRLLDWANG
ncbi:MAG: hypothetical protein ABWX84_03645, partial [Nocardioides sp.]